MLLLLYTYKDTIVTLFEFMFEYPEMNYFFRTLKYAWIVNRGIDSSWLLAALIALLGHLEFDNIYLPRHILEFPRKLFLTKRKLTSSKGLSIL